MASPLENGTDWILKASLKFRDGQGGVHVVPAGFVTDYASVPDTSRLAAWCLILTVPAGWWLLWNEHWKWFIASALVSSFALWVAAISHRLSGDARVDAGATQHDWQYRKVRGSKMRADLLLFEALGASGVPDWKRVLIYGSVAIFGFHAWNSDNHLNV